jgi:hypothetical protein
LIPIPQLSPGNYATNFKPLRANSRCVLNGNCCDDDGNFSPRNRELVPAQSAILRLNPILTDTASSQSDAHMDATAREMR